MTHIKGERLDSFDRLHFPDGTHRTTPRSADGQEVDWFEQHAGAHQSKHKNVLVVNSGATEPGQVTDAASQHGDMCVFFAEISTLDDAHRHAGMIYHDVVWLKNPGEPDAIPYMDQLIRR